MDGLVTTGILALEAGSSSTAIVGAVFACSLIIIGAALSISFIGIRAVESIARQPEAGARIFAAMTIAAALVEGVTFFALLVCFLAVFWMH